MAQRSASSASVCPICEHAHWKHEPHVWAGASCKSTTTTKARKSSPRKNALKSSEPTVARAAPLGNSPSPIVAECVTGGTSATSGIVKPKKPKTDRKEYLRLKAIERRAATKLGLTVQEYRARNGKG